MRSRSSAARSRSSAASWAWSRAAWRRARPVWVASRACSAALALVSLVVKFGALAFVLFLKTEYAINLQLLGGVWILQTLPAVVLGLYTRWFHRGALLLGWAAGILVGTWMAWSASFKSVAPFTLFGLDITVYPALVALVVNLLAAAVATPLLDAAGTD